MTRIRIVAIATAVALVAAACTSSSTTTTADTPTTTVGPTNPDLLVIGEIGGGVVVVDEKGTEVERYDPPAGARYAQPIWASSDTIVYAQSADLNNRLVATRLGGETVWSVALATPPFFYLASKDPEGTTVLSLRNYPDQAGLLIELIAGQDAVNVVSNEAPFFASWNPVDGTFVSHVGDVRLDVARGSTVTISSSSSGYQAPVWLPSGIVALREVGGDAVLSRWADDAFSDIAGVRGAARFVASANSIAIATGGSINTNGMQASAQALPMLPSGVLTVIDLDTGTFSSVTADPSPVFQWDPNGEKLLFSTFVDDPVPALMWHVWKDGEIEDFDPFVPEASWFGTFAPFFDQYAQSVSLWSPDGSAFTYPAVVDGDARIMIQRLDGTEATELAPGNWVAWIPNS